MLMAAYVTAYLTAWAVGYGLGFTVRMVRMARYAGS